ncbi:AraC family transcriptional regulator [Halocynthiibacter sp. C4]|uniref:helix-turn-helix domain-containing protein n=1 Tax=Halocynthiibacter sp. C4 TaxID=2992758 RepID=UPI00237C250F|nr:AraC family transcriptional regulator [Halocynthiibacter sp. C4]MDE0591499.1 AraC family transcriptional regulator [Halocynthiibacter sp. C4]
MTGAGVGWRKTEVDVSEKTDLEVGSDKSTEIIFTQIALRGGFTMSSQDGQNLNAKSVSLTRLAHKSVVYDLVPGPILLFGIHMHLDVIGRWFGDTLPNELKPFARDQVDQTLCQKLTVPAPLRAALQAQLSDTGPLARIATEGITLQIMSHLMYAAAQETIVEHSVDAFQIRCAHEAMDILRQNLANPPLIAEIAVMVGLSTHRLERAFIQVHGVTIRQALVDLRFEAACVALRHGEAVKTIAHRLGYANASNFTYAFRRKFGQPPKAWRNANARPPLKYRN